MIASPLALTVCAVLRGGCSLRLVGVPPCISLLTGWLVERIFTDLLKGMFVDWLVGLWVHWLIQSLVGLIVLWLDCLAG